MTTTKPARSQRPAFTFGDLTFATLAPSAFRGAVSIFQVDLGASCLSGPLHVHDNEDGISYVVSGKLIFQVGDDLLETAAGETVLLPRDVPHTFWNPGPEPARALDVVTPGGLENYYARLGSISPAAAMEQLAAMEAEFGVHMDWDSIETLTARYGLRLAAA
jgi:mannose-6-phosphate isomerase-like protein (cupin superfamily)